MMLLDEWLDLTQSWVDVFPQERTADRARRQGLGSLIAVGRRTLTRIIWANGGEQESWAAEYFLYSRVKWEPQALFTPVVKNGLDFCTGPLVGIALDDTKLHKTGRCIQQAFYQRDPLSPPFHTNLILGLRFLQASLLLPLHKHDEAGCRALPIRFEESSRVERPARKASEEEWKNYRKQCKLHNLSTHFVDMAKKLRIVFDDAGAAEKILVLAVDNSFCNRTVFNASFERIEIIARSRKDAVLCLPAPKGAHRVYDVKKFTPEDVRKDDTIPWRTAKIWYGGKRREIRYKEVASVLWQGGARRKPLRLIVVAPTPYLKRNSGKYYYRNPAYLLTTDLGDNARDLLQIYFDRWQIEVNHREEKDTLGVGQAQLWNPTSVPRQPVLVVAAYSALLLAGLRAFGTKRTDAYAALPKWRRKAQRPSCLDLVALIRKEIDEHPEKLNPLQSMATAKRLAAAANA
jgi:hypothetical protein